jgi:hypothetical protein
VFVWSVVECCELVGHEDKSLGVWAGVAAAVGIVVAGAAGAAVVEHAVVVAAEAVAVVLAAVPPTLVPGE